MTRRDLISGPYKNCPNPECLDKESFGVFMPISGSRTYSRECIKCWHRQDFDLPKIQKKIVYLDQFVISNLIKLLDKSHPSHQKIKSDPFWESLFIKLEKASKTQAIICPDSFYHRDESITGGVNFRLMKRLYEHFSNGKTLYPSLVVEKSQITHHFAGWLTGKKVEFVFKPEDISFDGDLHSWSTGMRISVGGGPYPGQIDNLQKTNAMTSEQLEAVWTRWQSEKEVNFTERTKEEASGLWKGLVAAAKQFEQRREVAMLKIINGENYEMDLDDFLPPMSNDILEALMEIAKSNGLASHQIPETFVRYFNDSDLLLKIPQIKISCVMFAGLSHRAKNGKKNPPKSTVDVQFISSYLPYCDALFVDKESAALLEEFPKNTPQKLRLKEFPAQVFSLGNKEKFLDYLDQLVANIPESQVGILKDMEGENYHEPYWSIIEHEKQSIEDGR